MNIMDLVRKDPVPVETPAVVAEAPVLQRDFDASRINAIANHPDVHPWITQHGAGAIDMSAIVADLNNVLLMTDVGGLLFHQIEVATSEVHTTFLPEARGPGAMRLCREALRWMFIRTNCMEVVTKVPAHNRCALGMVRACKFRHDFHRAGLWMTDEGAVDVHFFGLRFWDWLWSAPDIEDLGAWFHRRLTEGLDAIGLAETQHGDDAAHDQMVGAALDMVFARQVEQALVLYAHWARFAGYAPAQLLSVTPDLVIDIGTARLIIGNDDFRVLPPLGVA